MYYVMGKDENGQIILMTQSGFRNEAEAQCYKSTCAAGWNAFVVQTV